MSEFLRELLKKAKESADGLDAPPEEAPDQNQEPESDETGNFLPKPGLMAKPGSGPGATTKSGFDTKPDSPGESGSPTKFDLTINSGLRVKSGSGPDATTKPDLVTKSDSSTRPGSATKPGLLAELGLVAEPNSMPVATTKPGLSNKPGSPSESEHVQALRIFTTSQRYLRSVMPDFKDSELRLYHYLVEQTFGNPDSPSDHVIEYSQRRAMQASNIKSTATIVKAMSVLVKNRLVKWVRRSRKRGQSSLIKVFLPDEMSTNKDHS
jgi:hypothetical protein